MKLCLHHGYIFSHSFSLSFSLQGGLFACDEGTISLETIRQHVTSRVEEEEGGEEREEKGGEKPTSQKILCAPLDGLVEGGGEGEKGGAPIIEGVYNLFCQHSDILLSDSIGDFSLTSRLLVVFSRFVWGRGCGE